MIRNPDRSFLNTTPRELRRPLFPVPEDIFASDDQVAERHEQEIRSPAIDQAIANWNDAREQGDESGLRAAAKSIVDATTAAFKLQGVPLYAHPVLPPQFVKAESIELRNLPHEQQKATVSALLNKFDPSARPGGMQQFAGLLASPAADFMQDDEGSTGRRPSPFVTAQAQPPQPFPQQPPRPGHPPAPRQPNQPPRPLGGPPGPGQPQQQLPWWQQPLLPTQPGDPPLQESQSGNFLAPTNRLSPGLRTYLGGLDWRNPTDNVARGQDNQGGGGFNGTRQNNGRRYPHGAQDQMAQPDQYVTAPVTGRLVGFGTLPGSQWPYMDIALDHGVIVRVIHVEEPLDPAGRRYLRPGETVRAGQIIGTQQNFHNNARLRPVPVHAHVQIMVPIPGAVNPRNGGPVYYLVDPSLFIQDPDYVN